MPKFKTHPRMYPKIQQYLREVATDFSAIPPERKKLLDELAEKIRETHQLGNTAQLTFICTHNSRRSHLGQVWAAVAAHYLGVQNIETYSGGTEATAFNPRAVAALERVGFRIENPGGENPHYRLYFAKDAEPLLCFSKKYDDPANPQKDFIAIMTCSDADENCPFISGAAHRFALTYRDPKEADGTLEEVQRYDERCRQIAAKMLYLMKKARLPLV